MPITLLERLCEANQDSNPSGKMERELYLCVWWNTIYIAFFCLMIRSVQVVDGNVREEDGANPEATVAFVHLAGVLDHAALHVL